jgi:hypothetical protein
VDKEERRLTSGSHGGLLVWSRRYRGDGCEKIGVVLENLDDQTKYSVLGNAGRR